MSVSRVPCRVVFGGLLALVTVLCGLWSCSGGGGAEADDAARLWQGEAWDNRTDLRQSEPVDLSLLQKELSRQETIEGALVRGNVDLSRASIQYFSQTASGEVGGSFPEEKEPLALVDYGPTGELPIEMRQPTIHVMFNHPMVPLAKLGEVMTTSPLMKIEPAVKGVYRWYGTRVLSFEPEAPLVDNPRYVVTVTGEAKSLGGRRLDQPFVFEFHTEPVAGVNFYAGKDADSYTDGTEVPPAVGKFMVLEFNQPVEPDHIRQFLQVRAGSQPVGFSVGRPEYPERLKSRTDRAVLVTLDREPAQDTQVSLILLDQASPKPGYPARTGDQSFSYATISPFKVTYLDSWAWDLPRTNKPEAVPVYLQFSHPLDPKAASLSYTVKVNGQPVKPLAQEVFDYTLRLGLPGLEPDDEVEIRASAQVKDIYGRSLTNPGEAISCFIPRPSPLVDFPWGFNQLESRYPPRFIWEGRNLDGVQLGAAGRQAYLFDIDDEDESLSLQAQDTRDWKANKTNYNLVELKPWLNKSGFGTVYFRWLADWSQDGDADQSNGRFAIQVTDLGVTTRYAWNRLLVWVNSLGTGQPVADATVQVAAIDGTVMETRTGKDGLAILELKPGQFAARYNVRYGYRLPVSVIKGDDRCDLLASDSHNSWSATTYGHANPGHVEEPRARVFMFTDRGLYKPGEELALRGIHWNQNPQGFKPYADAYRLELKDPRDGTVLWEKTAKASMSGGFAHRLELPEELEPGEYTIYYHPLKSTNDNDDAVVSFTIAQFRKVAFQVKSTVPGRVFTQGDEVSVEVAASYLAGGVLPGGGYSYYWTRRPVAWAPKGVQFNQYVFGPGTWEGEHTLTNGQGTLGGNGQVVLREQTSGQNAPGAVYDYVLETTVQDIDRQAIASTAHVLVHPAAFHIGTRFASGSTDGWWSRFVATNQNVKVQSILVDPEGGSWNAETALTATVTLGSWKETQQQGVYGRVNTRWDYVETEVSRRELKARNGAVEFDFAVKEAGDYLLALEGRDRQGRTARTVIRFYATGSDWVLRASETPSEITMILDKEEYLPGETARILVRSPVSDGTYLMTLEREGIYEQKLVSLKGGQTMLEVPVKESYVPVFYVALTSCTKREATPTDYFEPDLGKPRSLFGIVGIRVSTRPVELDVEVMALKGAYKPGEKAEVAVKVSRQGQPVANAEVSILAVDRGVLDLIDYHVPNPLDFFYSPWNFPLGVHGDDSRRLLMKPVTYDTSTLTGGDGEGEDKEKTRSDFRPLALFEPFVATDKNGVAKVSFTLPDSLTTYRLTAVALRENRLGFKENELLVQNPVNVRTALPRRWRNRDTAAAGVVLQNLTREVQKLEVSVQSDILLVAGESSRSVEVPAGGVYELPFVLSAARPGEGSITFRIKSDVLNESLVEPVLVERPLVKEAFATVGYLAPEAASATEGLVIPRYIAPGYGSLSLKASASVRSYLEPSLERLLELPDPWDDWYERLSHAFAAVWQKTDAAGVNALLADLAGRQQPDGGIYTGSYSWRPLISSPFISLVTAQFMEFAGAQGFEVRKAPDFDRLAAYLQSIKNAGKDSGNPSLYIEDPWFHAYNALVLADAHRVDKAYLERVGRYGDALGLGGYGLLAQAWQSAGDTGKARELLQRCKNFVLIGTQSIDLKETYEAASWWSSSLSELALFMKNSLELGEDMEYVLRIAGSLNRSDRHWRTRADDLWTMLGFLPVLDKEGPATAGVKLAYETGGTALASLDAGKSGGDAQVLEFNQPPLASLERDKALTLDLKKTGSGPAYHTAILRYALPTETARSRDEGLEVNQRWETLDGQAVKPDSLKPGVTYRVRTDLSSTKRRANLELLVPVPSGVEIVDPGFKLSGRFANQGGSTSETIERETVYGDTVEAVAEGYGGFEDGDWYWFWYNPDSFALDNMMVYRWTDFYAGSRSVSFLVRATTPGIYPTPPAQASLQFEPEVFGRADGALFVIKP